MWGFFKKNKYNDKTKRKPDDVSLVDLFSFVIIVFKQIRVNYSLHRLSLQMVISTLAQVKERFWLFVNMMARLCGVLRQAHQFGHRHGWIKAACCL